MWKRLRRWLHNLPIHDPIERRQALLVQVVLLGLCGVLMFSALLTLVALPFTSGEFAAANLRNSINNACGTLFVLVPLVLLRRGYFRIAVAILMLELFLLAFNTFSPVGLEAGWLGVLELALPISLAALALGRRWLVLVYLVSLMSVGMTAFTWYPIAGIPRNAPSAVIVFALVAGLLALFLDRFGTALRESLAALRESEERYRLIADNAVDLISLIDQSGCFLYASPSYQLVLGYAPGTLIGRPAIDYVHPDDQSRWFTTEHVGQLRIRYCHANGSWRWIEVRGTTVVRQGQSYLLATGRDVTEQQQIETALAHQYSLLSAVIESTPDAVSVQDLQGRYLMINSASASMLGLAAQEVLGKDDDTLFEADIAGQMRDDIRRVIERGDTWSYEQHTTIQGVSRTYLATKRPYLDQQGSIAGMIATAHDITEYKHLEAQLVQSQKMESIGQLAGGIAHDFNNMLSAVIGFIGIARAELPEQSPVEHDLEVAENAAWRAVGLTRQLLAFARKQVVEPRVINLNTLILDLDKMLRRLIGEEIELVTRPAPDLGQIKADPGHIEQVIVNMAVNARDAMPNGGRLTIETANTILESDYTDQHVGVDPGAYVLLAISDTGSGMDAEVQQHIFEPFYTTKEVGKGTGLGLSTCYGIIKQHGGHIWVYSEVGYGTTFKIYLHRVEESAELVPPSSQTNAMLRGSETVLLVEDEPLVRELSSTILQAQGYTVLEASNGEEALQLVWDATATMIDLLITDVVMPGMRGKALADQVADSFPDIKVLFISGYATDAMTYQGQLEPGTHFLSKPFTRAAFARKVREVLDS